MERMGRGMTNPRRPIYRTNTVTEKAEEKPTPVATYAQGFKDGRASAFSEIIHCRNCRHSFDMTTERYSDGTEYIVIGCSKNIMHGKPGFFCAFGEERTTGDGKYKK